MREALNKVPVGLGATKKAVFLSSLMFAQTWTLVPTTTQRVEPSDQVEPWRSEIERVAVSL